MLNGAIIVFVNDTTMATRSSFGLPQVIMLYEFQQNDLTDILLIGCKAFVPLGKIWILFGC